MASEGFPDLHYQFLRFDNSVRSPLLSCTNPAGYLCNCSIWNVENKRKQKTVIVVKSKERGARTKVNTCAYSPDGSLIGGGKSSKGCVISYERAHPLHAIACFDGALHMWQTKSNFVRPSMTVEGAHSKGSETGSLVFSVDGNAVLTRGGDDTVKRTFSADSRERVRLTLWQVWDLRSFKKPFIVRSGLTTLYPNTNAIFSPDNKYVVTGAGATMKGGKGHLLFMKKDTFETVKDLEVNTTPVKVFWHSKINQVYQISNNVIPFDTAY